MSCFNPELLGIYAAIVCGLLGLVYVWFTAKSITAKDAGNEVVQKISKAIHGGAMTFLFREYRYIAVFVAVVAALMFMFIAQKTALAFIIGALCSIAAGYIGMTIATRANARTAQAATRSFNEALGVAFPGGAVMGVSVVSLGLLGLSLVFLAYIKLSQQLDLAAQMVEAVNLLVGFSLGASSVALFARVGGGIYTKAADVGADLVGKVEAGIPEDDPRNPAVIADNVGDNVGDVAGMGADLFESYAGAIISAMVIVTTAAGMVDVRAIMLVLYLSG